jgi:hypothetical protein
MALCDVLRCPNVATRVISLNQDGGPLMEAAVCDDHSAAIDAGAPYRWDVDPRSVTDGALVMGADLDAGPVTVLSYRGTEEHGLVTAPDGTTATVLVFEQLLGDGARQDFRLLMGDTVLDQLREAFSDETWLGARPVVDEPGDDLIGPVDQGQLVRDATAVMTAWAGGSPDNAFAIETALEVADERYPGDEQTGSLYLVGALGTLCGLLLAQRRADTGATHLETLRMLGEHFAG